jgi:hypothetical protein
MRTGDELLSSVHAQGREGILNEDACLPCEEAGEAHEEDPRLAAGEADRSDHGDKIVPVTVRAGMPFHEF